MIVSSNDRYVKQLTLPDLVQSASIDFPGTPTTCVAAGSHTSFFAVAINSAKLSPDGQVKRESRRRDL